MENLPKDVLYSIAMELDCPEVLAYCLTNKRIYDKGCNHIYFMKNKLIRDFGINYDGKDPNEARKYYNHLCNYKNNLDNLDKLNIYGTIQGDIYIGKFRIVDQTFLPRRLGRLGRSTLG